MLHIRPPDAPPLGATKIIETSRDIETRCFGTPVETVSLWKESRPSAVQKSKATKHLAHVGKPIEAQRSPEKRKADNPSFGGDSCVFERGPSFSEGK